MAVLTALDLSKYILHKCTVENKPISNLQLQKILFFAQKAVLQKYDEPLFNEELEAWRFGPVSPEVYYKYKGYGSSDILVFEINKKPDANYKKIIDQVVEDKRTKYIWDLVEESHKKDGSWYKIFDMGKGEREIIPKGLIKQYG